MTEYVDFWPAGSTRRASSTARSAATASPSSRSCPLCPMCGGRSWEQSRGARSARRRADCSEPKYAPPASPLEPEQLLDLRARCTIRARREPDEHESARARSAVAPASLPAPAYARWRRRASAGTGSCARSPSGRRGASSTCCRSGSATAGSVDGALHPATVLCRHTCARAQTRSAAARDARPGCRRRSTRRWARSPSARPRSQAPTSSWRGSPTSTGRPSPLAAVRAAASAALARRARGLAPRGRGRAGAACVDRARLQLPPAAAARRRARVGAPARRSAARCARRGPSSARSSCYRGGRAVRRARALGVELAAAQVALALRAFGAATGSAAERARPRSTLAGDALAAGSTRRTRRRARARRGRGDGARASASSGRGEPGGRARRAVARLDAARPATARERASQPRAGRATRARCAGRGAGCPAGAASRRRSSSASRRVGLLQLALRRGAERRATQLARLDDVRRPRRPRAPRGRASRRRLALELERTRALLAVVGQAIAQLSLAHTLETAVERVAELLGVERVAVYLRRRATARVPPPARGSPGRTRASPSGCSSSRSGRPRRAASLDVADAGSRSRACAACATRSREAGIEAAVAVPLARARARSIGLLAVYPAARPRVDRERGGAARRARRASSRSPSRTRSCTSRRSELGDEREDALASERQAARQPARALRDLALVRAEPLARDDARGRRAHGRRGARRRRGGDPRCPTSARELLVPRAVHVADARLADAVRDDPLAAAAVRRRSSSGCSATASRCCSTPDRRGARRRARAARAVPREGLDGGGRCRSRRRPRCSRR